MKKLLFVTVFLCFIPSLSQAISIQYELSNVSGNRYQYVYTVTNDGSLGTGTPVRLFDVLFDTTLYKESSITITTSAALSADWDEMILFSVPGDPTAYDAFSASTGVAVGQSVSGFTVEFDWLGTGTPGTQPFEVYDPSTFALLETGTTQLKSTVSNEDSEFGTLIQELCNQIDYDSAQQAIRLLWDVDLSTIKNSACVRP